MSACTCLQAGSSSVGSAMVTKRSFTALFACPKPLDSPYAAGLNYPDFSCLLCSAKSPACIPECPEAFLTCSEDTQAARDADKSSHRFILFGGDPEAMDVPVRSVKYWILAVARQVDYTGSALVDAIVSAKRGKLHETRRQGASTTLPPRQ